jgi:hypothetical protein
MQMPVMTYGEAAPELAATANISAFNAANAFGGLMAGPWSTMPALNRLSEQSVSRHMSDTVRTHTDLRKRGSD